MIPEREVIGQTDDKRDMAFIAATMVMAFLLPLIGPMIMVLLPITPPKAKKLAKAILALEIIALVATCALGLAIAYMPQLFDIV
jgi:hypothetical protein